MPVDEMINMNDCMLGTLSDNGEFKPIGKISDVKFLENDSIDETATKVYCPSYFNANRTCEFSMNLTMSKKARKRSFNMLLYGWRAKGILRRRMLFKAWNRRIRAAGHFKEA